MSDPHIELFLEMMSAERAASPHTIAAYRRDLEGAETLLRRTLSGAGAGHLEALLSAWAKQGLAPSTSARKLSSLKQFYRFLQTENIRPDSPAHNLRAPKQGRPLPKILSEDDVDALFQSAQKLSGPLGMRTLCQLEILYAGGLRVSELVSLPLAATGRGDNCLFIRGKGAMNASCP